MLATALAHLTTRPWFATAAKWGAIALTVSLALLGAFKAAQRSGRLLERAEAMQRTIQQTRRRDAIEDDIRRLGPGAANERLQRDWNRGG